MDTKEQPVEVYNIGKRNRANGSDATQEGVTQGTAKRPSRRYAAPPMVLPHQGTSSAPVVVTQDSRNQGAT